MGWVLSAIDKSSLKVSQFFHALYVYLSSRYDSIVSDSLTLQTPPPVAVLPLGTGNDLARMLGWGKGYECEDLESVIQDVYHAPVALLDRCVCVCAYKCVWVHE